MQDFLKEIKSLARNRICSTDVLEVSLYKRMPVFLYDAYKKGFGCHNMLPQSERVGQATTCGRSFALFKERIQNEYDAIAFDVSNWPTEKQIAAPIFGDIHLLTDEDIFELDVLMGNGYARQRRRIWCRVLPSKERSGAFLTSAWCYFAIKKTYEEELISGDLKLMNRMIPKNKMLSPYYLFTPSDQKEKNNGPVRPMCNM